MYQTSASSASFFTKYINVEKSSNVLIAIVYPVVLYDKYYYKGGPAPS